MEKIKAISLDRTGTISEEDFSNAVWLEGVPKLYALKHSIPIDKAREIVFSQYKEVGEERREWYDIKYWFKRLGLGDGWKDLLYSYKERIKIYEDAKEIIPELAEKYPLILLSNAGREFIEIELREGGILPYFTKIISATQDMGEVKKTPSFYKKALKLIGLPPQNLLHIGDHPLFDYKVPRKAGIKAFLLDRKEKYRVRFKIKTLSQIKNILDMNATP